MSPPRSPAWKASVISAAVAFRTHERKAEDLRAEQRTYESGSPKFRKMWDRIKREQDKADAAASALLKAAMADDGTVVPSASGEPS